MRRGEKGAGWGVTTSSFAGFCCFLILALGFFRALVQHHSIEQHKVPSTPASAALAILREDPSLATPQSAEEFAETAFEYWRTRVHPQIAALNVREAGWRGPEDDTWQRLQDLNLSSTGDHCLYLFSYQPSAESRLRVSWDENSKVCRMGGGDPFYQRAKVLAAALETVMEPHKDKFDHPFQVRFLKTLQAFSVLFCELWPTHDVEFLSDVCHSAIPTSFRILKA